MKNIKIVLIIATVTILSLSAQAKDQIRIVGSSTIYPFSSSVAEELGATTKFPTPVVESTGSGGGMKLFCKSNDINTPDITNASRRMKKNEFKLCKANGVSDITEVLIGFDGIVFAQSSDNKIFNVTKKQLFLAVAAEVPSADGKSLIKNPYKSWNQIDKSLPKRDIIIYGPPTSSGTRDAFEDMVMKSLTKKMDIYTNAGFEKYHKVRQDGRYVPSGENDNIIVRKLTKNKKAFGIFGYSFLIENDDKISSAIVNGVAPTPTTVSNGKYSISRSLFFYIKNSHSKSIPALDKYISLFISDDMIGEDSILSDIGLIHLPTGKRKIMKSSVANRTKLTIESLKH